MRDLPAKKILKVNSYKRQFKREIQHIRFRDVKAVWSACNDREYIKIDWEEMREKHCVAFWKPESLKVAVWRYAKKRKTSDPQIATLREKDILIAAKLFYHQGVTYKKMCKKITLEHEGLGTRSTKKGC